MKYGTSGESFRIGGLWVGVMVAAALVATSGANFADAHWSDNTGPLYHDVFLEVTYYERVSYDGFDMIQIELNIDNNEPFPLKDPTFLLGGIHNDTEDSALVQKEDYGTSSYVDIINKGGQSLKSYCTTGENWNTILADSNGTAWLCFDVDASFQPDGLLVSGDIGHRDHEGKCYTHKGYAIDYDFRHEYTNWPVCAIQVVPLNEDSTYCNYRYSQYCDDTNLQNITKWTKPAQEPEPEPIPSDTAVEPDDADDATVVNVKPETASIQYVIYTNGTLVLIFDQPVEVSKQDRIGIVTDLDRYLHHGNYSHIGNANLSRMDTTLPHDEVLIFTLSNSTHELITDYVSEYKRLTVVMDVGAIHVGKDNVDITKYHNDEPVLFYDTIIIE